MVLCRHVAVALLACLCVPVAAHAARIMAKPRLMQLEEGFGFVVATVTESVRTDKNAERPMQYSVTFETADIVAPPVGEAWPLKVGDKIELSLGVGYGNDLEMIGQAAPNGKESPFVAGKKYLLALRWDAKAAKYVNAFGASSLEDADTLSDARRAELVQLRELAALDSAARRAACLKIIADAKAAQALRLGALQEFSFAYAGKLTPEERTALGAALKKVFVEPENGLDDVGFAAIDTVVRSVDDAWDKSAERRGAWLTKLLAPFDAPGDPTMVISNRHNNFSHLVAEFIAQDSAGTLPKLAKAIADEKTPPMWRWSLLAQVSTAYCMSAKPDLEMEKILNREWPAVLNAGDGWVLRLSSATLKTAMKPDPAHSKRAYAPLETTRTALNAALVRMRMATVSVPPDLNASTAVEELESVLKALAEVPLPGA